jgi:hypothetical protein
MPHEANLHWTCHECGGEIDDMARATIIDHRIYHIDHAPDDSWGMMRLVSPRPVENQEPTETTYAREDGE